MAGKNPVLKTRRDWALALGLGLLLLVAWWAIGRAAVVFESDPDYFYLFNGLEIFTLKIPYYYTHPGTPVEMLIAVVVGLAWLVFLPWHGVTSAPDHVVQHRELYLNILNGVLALANAAALGFFAVRVRRAGAGYGPALFGALSLFLFAPAFLAIHRVDPEPVLMAAGLVLAGMLAPFAFTPNFAPDKRYAVAMGALLGFCLAVKVTSAPFLIMLALLPDWYLRRRALIAALASGLIFTLPIAPHYWEMLLWYLGLYTHQGGYGSGASGLPPVSDLIADAKTMLALMPETFLCLALYAVAILALTGGKLRGARADIKVLGLSLVLIAVDLLLVLKQPEPRYTIATVPFLCLGNAILARIVLARGSMPAWAGAAALVALLGVWRADARAEAQFAIRQSAQKVVDEAASSSCLVAQYYGLNAPLYNVFFANGWSGGAFKDRLMKAYPAFLSYGAGAARFEAFNDALTTEQSRARIAQAKCVWLMGSPLERFGNFGIPASSLKQIDRSVGGPREAIAIYQLEPGWDRDWK